MPPESDQQQSGQEQPPAGNQTGQQSGSEQSQQQQNDRGFPENTAVADMTAAEQAAYWKFQSRKHEARASAFGGTTPEDLARLQERARKADEYEAEKGTDTERATRSAYAEAEKAADGKYQPLLVRAEFKAAAAGRMDADRLATILEPLDLSRFLAADGTVDTAKVTAYVDGIAPATGGQQQHGQSRRGPSPSGQGRGNHNAGADRSVAAGRDLYASMHPKKAHAS